MDKTMADNLMYIPNDDSQNYYFFRLQLVVKMFGHSTYCTNLSKKSLKLLSQQIGKRYYKNFGDECNKQSNVPSLPGKLPF